MGAPPVLLAHLRSAMKATTPGQGLRPDDEVRFDLQELAGRLVELRGEAALTAGLGLVLEAQQRGEPAAYVGAEASSFYPPDAAEGGVDLEALVVIRAREAAGPAGRARAAEELVRSGAFALVLVDLGSDETRLPPALLARLLALAQKHQAAIVFLSSGGGEDAASPLGSLVSLRARTRRASVGETRLRCAISLEVVKDKRRAPGWTHAETCRAPVGLR